MTQHGSGGGRVRVRKQRLRLSEDGFNPRECRVRYFRGRVSNCNLSEARKHCFLASDWLEFVTLPQKYRTLERITYSESVFSS